MTILNLLRRKAEDEIPSGTINGTNDTFTLANTPRTTSSIKLHRNGNLQLQGVHYDMSTTTITFKAGKIPKSGNTLRAEYEY